MFLVPTTALRNEKSALILYSKYLKGKAEQTKTNLKAQQET
jgi:hypothetical protein